MYFFIKFNFISVQEVLNIIIKILIH